MATRDKDPSIGLNAAVAAELRAERAAQQLTVEALAGRSGIPKRTLLRLLNAERAISLDALQALADAFGLQMSALITRGEERLSRERERDVAELGKRRVDWLEGLPPEWELAAQVEPGAEQEAEEGMELP
ncbi:helix-turn-helix domain-containing protein [Actinomyces ruminis]|uniref:XRE family transcriptional regulator n=1 Tax=Actinomyces ruminis TaxID=1937003 RepID=A0ABX4MAV7_9ACTO|nr:helix-turn-helix transcriptional regulator [Actinomyces ruminis]PHP52566.1 XRE family transcriptional regulator [Actinomyces ruminis]